MEIFNNIPSSSTVLCLNCSIKTIELIKINIKLSNIDFECKYNLENSDDLYITEILKAFEMDEWNDNIIDLILTG